MKIDVVMCTRNRLAMLRDGLPILLGIVAETPDAALLVVDNGSTDGTVEFLAETADRHSAMRVLTELRTGAYHARCRAIAASRADIIVFVDDDVIPAPDFLTVIVGAFDDPGLGVVGGSIEGLFEGDVPSWCTARLLSHVPVLPLTEDVEACVWPYYPPSACLGIRRAPCLDFYLAPERSDAGLGPGGNVGSDRPLYFGEDTDLCEIFARAGYRITRLAAFRCQHRTSAARLTPQWFIKRFAEEGRTRVRLSRLRQGSAFGPGVPKMLAALPAFLLLRLAAPLLPARAAVTVRAYCAKSLAAWGELLRDRQCGPLPYPDAPARAAQDL